MPALISPRSFSATRSAGRLNLRTVCKNVNDYEGGDTEIELGHDQQLYEVLCGRYGPPLHRNIRESINDVQGVGTAGRKKIPILPSSINYMIRKRTRTAQTTAVE